MLVHRCVGYIVMMLVFMSVIGALIIAPRTFGGDIGTQLGIYVLAVLTYTALSLAWWNIRRLRIDQHRKWMIRAMVWMSQIITLRVIVGVGLMAVNIIGGPDIVRGSPGIQQSSDRHPVANLWRRA